jgi:hypothetical protein
MMHPLSAGTCPPRETGKEDVPQYGKGFAMKEATLIKEGNTY